MSNGITLRLRFWFLVMDVCEFVFGFCSEPYHWAVGKAGEATDWGEGVDCRPESER